jgi:hypothetical protein
MIRPQPYSTVTRAGDSTHVVQEIITERSESRGLTLHSVCENNLWLRDQSWLDARNVSRRDSHNALGRPRPWRVHGNNDRRHRVLDIHKKGLAPRDHLSGVTFAPHAAKLNARDLIPTSNSGHTASCLVPTICTCRESRITKLRALLHEFSRHAKSSTSVAGRNPPDWWDQSDA